MEDYQSFFQKNGRLIDDLGLSPSHCIRHMRLLSLCSLAAERQEIPYAVIGTTLQVDPSDVEGWVVSAVSSGLIEAKMDQVKKVVIVERCVVRKVDMKQWKGLQTKLNSWKKNIQVVLDGLKESHALHGNHLLNM